MVLPREETTLMWMVGMAEETFLPRNLFRGYHLEAVMGTNIYGECCEMARVKCVRNWLHLSSERSLTNLG